MAAILVIIGAVSWAPALAVAALVGGVAWVTVITNLNTAAQLRLPDWVRARGLGSFQPVFQSSLALGGLLWGLAAEILGVEAAMAAAGGVTILDVLLGGRWSLATSEGLDLHPATLWPEPRVEPSTDPDDGPILVQVTYRIDPAQSDAFIEAMGHLGRLRQRDGASRWLLSEDAASPGRFVESFLVETWAEHLRQHLRGTESDRATEERVLGFQLDGVPVEPEHLVARASR
jgi:quinol monooxygenase YgiN